MYFIVHAPALAIVAILSGFAAFLVTAPDPITQIMASFVIFVVGLAGYLLGVRGERMVKAQRGKSDFKV